MKQIINNWDQLTWDDYNNLLSYSVEEDMVSIIALLCGVDEEVVNNTPVSCLPAIDLTFLKTKPTPAAQTHFKLNNNKYTIELNPLKLTTKQYIEYNTFLASSFDDKTLRCLAVLIDGPFDEVVAQLHKAPITLIIG